MCTDKKIFVFVVQRRQKVCKKLEAAKFSCSCSQKVCTDKKIFMFVAQRRQKIFAKKAEIFVFGISLYL